MTYLLNVVYDECHKYDLCAEYRYTEFRICRVLLISPLRCVVMLSVVFLSIVILSVVVPLVWYSGKTLSVSLNYHWSSYIILSFL